MEPDDAFEDKGNRFYNHSVMNSFDAEYIAGNMAFGVMELGKMCIFLIPYA